MAASPIYSFPESATIQALERERLPVLANNYAGNRILPISEQNAETVLWEIQDDITGMTFARGAEEPYPVVDQDGITRFYTKPGRFGESMQISEEKMERMRQIGTLGDVINVDSEIADMQQKLAIREQVLIEYLRWQLLVFGVCRALKKDGGFIDVARFTPQVYNVSHDWRDPDNSTPLQDFRNVDQQYAGFGHSFGVGAIAWMNKRTGQGMLSNKNGSDLYGRRTQGLGSVLALKDANELFTGEGLANTTQYDENYLDAGRAVQRFIPDGYVVVTGYRADVGVQCGDYIMTRNASNPGGAPGIYAATGVAMRAPKLPYTERGHNGGLRIRYRRQVVVMKVWLS